jgi:hypothetical protein
MMHEFGDPGHTMGDHRVGAARVTSHDDGVVDVRPGAGAGCHRWYTRESGEALSRGHVWCRRGHRGTEWHGQGPVPRVAQARASWLRVARARVPVPCVTRHHALKYL